tara:strand:+ start:495 stop:1115 length:621 start_codon:yes stop_codon:yes gene_type:complete
MSKIQANQIQHTANGAAVFTLPSSDGTNGQFLKTNASGTLSFGSGGKILQVVSTTNDAYASVDTTKNTYYGSLSVEVAITPSSTSSLIYVVYDIVLSVEVDAREVTLVPRRKIGSGSYGALNRIGATGGSRTRVGVSQMSTSKHSACTLPMTLLDSPSTTSTCTYGFYHTLQHGGGWVVRNASFSDSNNADYARYASTVTAMEVAA